MMCEILERGPFVAVAHRGGGCEVAENTIAGIRHGLEAGVDIIEVDVRSSIDGELVLCHDEDLLRLCGVKKRVDALSIEELRSLKVFGLEPIATLAEALETVRGRAGMFIEIKEPATTVKIVEAVQAAKMQKDVCFISFFEEALQEVKRIDATLLTGLVYSKPPGKIMEAKDIRADLVLPYYRIATKKANDFAHSLHLRVGVWSVNRAEEIEKVVENGVDIVASDYITMLMSMKRMRTGD